MYVQGEFQDVIKSLMEGDYYTSVVLALAPDDLKERVGNDQDLVDIVKHMVNESTPEELAILYLRTINERDNEGNEVFAGVIDKLLEDLDTKRGDTHDSD